MSLSKRLLEQFIFELGEGPDDSQSPLNGEQSDDEPDPTKTKDGKRELNIGDPVTITGEVQFQGKTGDVTDFGKDKHFIVVNLYNHGKHSFHASDVEFNDYAGSEDEDADNRALQSIRQIRGFSN